MGDEEKILIHACCGICSGYPFQQLKENGYKPVAYFYNPNIDTEDEFERRLEMQKIVCKHFNIEIIAEPYCHKEFLNYTKGLESEPEHGQRCVKCFELRLNNTFKKAQDLNINKVTTSMTISPHKNFKLLSDIGKQLERNYNIEYLAIDFKKKDGFLKTNLISKELKLYRQNYCGCEFAHNN